MSEVMNVGVMNVGQSYMARGGCMHLARTQIGERGMLRRRVLGEFLLIGVSVKSVTARDAKRITHNGQADALGQPQSSSKDVYRLLLIFSRHDDCF